MQIRSWKQYQEDAAAFFRSIGLKAETDVEVVGARGRHAIDVYVQGSYCGIAFDWVVECKDWQSNIPKEKVMALYAITQDVGADRGFLLSERGFQSGAIRAAEKSNVTLTSLEDLSLATGPDLKDAIIGRLQWRIVKATHRLRQIKRQLFDDDYYPPTLEPLTKMLFLEYAFQQALVGDFPVRYVQQGDVWLEAGSFDELVSAADAIVTAAEEWTPDIEASA